MSSFVSLGGTAFYGPVVSVVGGTLTFFMVGTDSRMWWRTTSQGWTAFAGTGCTGHPAASTYGTTSYLACHGNGIYNALWYTKNSGSGWSSWTSLGGTVVDGPGIAATSSGASFIIQSTNSTDLENQLSSTGSATGWSADSESSLHGAGAGGA